MQGSLMHLINLPVHETGHLLFRPFGQFMMVAGGSIFQVIMPLLFFGYFAWNRKPYSAAIVLLWVGESILDVYIYANDAVVQQLVLTSGFTGSEGSFHDWNYLLTETGLINSTPSIGRLIRFIGTAVAAIAAAASIYFAFQETPKEEDL
jgi:hypothetical protein